MLAESEVAELVVTDAIENIDVATEMLEEEALEHDVVLATCSTDSKGCSLSSTVITSNILLFCQYIKLNKYENLQHL